MNLETFIARRQPGWTELERTVRRTRGGRLRNVTSRDLERFGLLYRHAASDLAIARRDFPGAGATVYLNSLCARAHPLVYRGDPARPLDLVGFFGTGIPRAFRAAGACVLLSLSLTLSGCAAGWLAVVLRPDLQSSLVPQSLFDQMARGDIRAHITDPAFAAGFIIQNNIRVALVCFIAGVLIGLPTALVLLSNGWMLGTLAAAVHKGGYDYAFWSLIAPHGILELSIIIIAGGSGLMIGGSLLRPGLLSRGDALVTSARQAVGLAVGVAMLLVIAGLTEAFISPSDLPRPLKLVWGVGLGILLYGWLLLSGRAPRVAHSATLDQPPMMVAT